MKSTPDTDIPEFVLPDINIGKEIHTFMKQAHFSATWLGGRMCCDRTNVYKILARHSLDTATLYKISLYLHQDFFSLYSRAFEALTQKNEQNSLPE